MRWLAECSADALGDALRAVAPELSRLPFTVPEPVAAIKADPLYWTSSAVLGGAVHREVRVVAARRDPAGA